VSFNTNAPFNAAIRNAGNRSRAIPDIGQGPGMQPAQNRPPAPQPMAAPPPPTSQPQMAPPPMGPPGGMAPPPSAGPPRSPMASPNVQPSTFTIHPPGTPADATQYNYEPQPDGSWRVYPPGVSAPPHTVQASLPRAASTGDYIRMARAFGSGATPPPAQAPGTY
jgi:hypothetical protein